MRSQVAMVLACSLALSGGARAQRLNLGGASAEPSAGEGLAALALAELLEREAAEQGGIGSAGRALRRLGAVLLRQGEGSGPGGAEAVLAGLSIGAKREMLDAILSGAPASARAAVESGAALTPASLAPRDIDLLLRDALAPLVAERAERCGWWAGPIEPGEPDELGTRIEGLRALAESRHLSDDAGEALRSMVELLELAVVEPGYERSALGWATLISEAAGAADDLPDWFSMDARDRLREDLSTGLTLCLDDPAASRATLRRTATLLRIVRACHGLPDPTPALRESVHRLVLAQEGEPIRDPAAVERIGEAFDRALALLGAPETAPAADTLVRQVRPMLEWFIASHGRASEAVRRALPRVLVSPDPLTEPGIVAAMQALGRAAQDLAIPANLSRMLAEWPDGGAVPFEPTRGPVPARSIAPVAEQIRRLGVSLGREDEAGAALGALREIDAISGPLLALPGELDVRAAEPPAPWRLVTGGQTSRLAFVIEQARREWVRAHSSERDDGGRAGANAAFRDLATAMDTLALGVASESLRLEWARAEAPTIDSWPGWEMSRPSADVIAEGLRERLGELASVIARGDEMERAAELASTVREDYASALLFARLEAMGAGVSLPACAAPAELGSGPPLDGAWLIGHRHALAQVCRSAYEAGAAGGEARAKFLAHANREALAVLDAIGP